MVTGAAPVSAEKLAQAECQKLDGERRALMVLGVDKDVEKGPDWAKANLTVADLDLVKRYFDLFEQLKFRCQEDIGVTEIDEPDTVDDDAPQTANQVKLAPANAAAAQGSASPSMAAPGAAISEGAQKGALAPRAPASGSAQKTAPLPASERRAKPAGGQSSAAAEPAYTGSTSTIEKASDANITSIAKRPRQNPSPQ
jgi:hypothetical protein